jgi:hypothetical protein
MENKMEPYNKELCEERHQYIRDFTVEVKNEMSVIHKKLNWFYLIAITTLVGVIINLLKSYS